MHVRLSLLTTFALALLAGCGGAGLKVGDPCSEPITPVCLDARTALDCYGGAYRAAPCAGAGGCGPGASSESVACDQSAAQPGDACVNFAIGRCLDGHTWLQCVNGFFVAHPCSISCTTGNNSVTCTGA